MASPQKENGNTGIANELLEKIVQYPWGEKSCSPLRLLLFVARKTYGFQKSSDVISLTQFQKGTHLARSTIIRSLRWLVAHALLVVGETTLKGRSYAINKDYDKWVVAPVLPLVAPAPPAGSTSATHNKNNNNKNILRASRVKPMNNEPVIEIREDGEPHLLSAKRETYGKYPAKIALYYCDLVGKRSASRQLPAAKELMKIACEDFPDDTDEERYKEILQRITVASKFYRNQRKILDWNLSKVAENWDVILKEWARKYV